MKKTFSPESFHLLGISGTAMSAVAGLLVQQGHRVSGSDQAFYPPIGDWLKTINIPVYTGFEPRDYSQKPDQVIVGNMISRGNKELEAILNAKIPYASMTQILKRYFVEGSTSLVVTGTHGKTTTTSLVSWLLEVAGKKPGFMIGGIPKNFPQHYRIADIDDPYFVIEGDEYDSAYFDKTPKFLHYLPNIGTITSIEYDHADIYESIDAILLQFRRFIQLIPSEGYLVVNADDANIRSLMKYALCSIESVSMMDSSAQWYVHSICSTESGTSFILTQNGTIEYHIHSRMHGRHNVWNTSLAVVNALLLSIPIETIQKALDTFQGVKRRMEVLATIGTLTLIDDFAHHPTAIKVTLEAIREKYPHQKIHCVFEPRSFTAKTKVFQNEYPHVFDAADCVILAATFEGTLGASLLDPHVLVQALTERSKEAYSFASIEEIINFLLEHVREGVLVIMSNGGFGGIHQKLIQKYTQTLL